MKRLITKNLLLFSLKNCFKSSSLSNKTSFRKIGLIKFKTSVSHIHVFYIEKKYTSFIFFHLLRLQQEPKPMLSCMI